MSRPSARRRTVVVVQRRKTVDEIDEEYFERAAERRRKREELAERLIAWLRRDGKAYSVEVGRRLRIKTTTAKSLLSKLEREGRLTSTLEESPKSGNGRRYYWDPKAGPDGMKRRGGADGNPGTGG